MNLTTSEAKYLLNILGNAILKNDSDFHENCAPMDDEAERQHREEQAKDSDLFDKIADAYNLPNWLTWAKVPKMIIKESKQGLDNNNTKHKNYGLDRCKRTNA